MSNNITKKSIRDCIVNILKDRVRINPELLVEENFDQELTSNELHLKARDMLRLFFEVEKEFNIKVSGEKIVKHQFNTINNITDIVFQSIS